MGYGDLQFFDIVIFAVIAAFLVFRLRNVLGKRAGFEKNNNANLSVSKNSTEKKPRKIHAPDLEDNIIELKKAYETIENFDHKNFLNGAKFAFETIINAFNQGDKKTLKKLLTDDVFKVFEKSLDNNKNEKEYQFFSLNIERVESVNINNGKIIIKIKFISEQFKNNDENTKVKNEDTWSFEKLVNSKNPNWLLCST